MAVAAFASMRLRASWNIDPNPIPIVNPNPPKKIPKSVSPSTTKSLKKDLDVSELFNMNRTLKQGKMEELYLGYETWVPVAPKVKNPRSVYNAASLAYMGDCIYELYARRHFLFPTQSIDEYNARVMAIVRCEAQDALLRKLLDEDYLSKEEREILRWGKNIGSNKTRTTKRAGVAVYNRASSLETLVGYLYLTDMKRLEELMLKLGFSTGASTERILEETHNKS
ncbi:uncharacterized protein LOC143859948 [Tasmannia lanceolata]|uniref:uncharacterized protein LOC143858659 n=1 Tax=Tasmannia lanceolata TaxID=3420 RepID=UPI004064577B